jgi:hypothetical protein
MLSCLVAGAAELVVYVVFGNRSPPDQLLDWPYLLVHSFGFGVVFAAIYEELRARGALPPGIRGGLAYGMGVFLAAMLLPVYPAAADHAVLLIQLACQCVTAGASVSAVAVLFRDPVEESDEPGVLPESSVMSEDLYWRRIKRSDQASAPAPRPARWNVISVCAPFLGFVCGVAAGMSAPHFRWFEWGFSVWLGFGVFGLLSAVIALSRAERLWGVTAIGLITNAILVFWLVPTMDKL